jgi:hypothetical protein
MGVTHDVDKEATPEQRPRRRRRLVIAAAALVAGGLAAGLAVGLSSCSSSLAPESANPQRDIVGTWTCTWADGNATAKVTVAPDDSASYSARSSNLAAGFKGQINGSTQGSVFTDPTHIAAAWELSLPVYAVHIRGSQMTLGSPPNPGETCTRQLPALGGSDGHVLPQSRRTRHLHLRGRGPRQPAGRPDPAPCRPSAVRGRPLAPYQARPGWLHGHDRAVRDG